MHTDSLDRSGDISPSGLNETPAAIETIRAKLIEAEQLGFSARGGEALLASIKDALRRDERGVG